MKYAIIDNQNKVLNVIELERPEDYVSEHTLVRADNLIISKSDSYDSVKSEFKRAPVDSSAEQNRQAKEDIKITDQQAAQTLDSFIKFLTTKEIITQSELPSEIAEWQNKRASALQTVE